MNSPDASGRAARCQRRTKRRVERISAIYTAPIEIGKMNLGWRNHVTVYAVAAVTGGGETTTPSLIIA